MLEEVVEVAGKDGDDSMMFRLIRYEICWDETVGGLLFLRCSMYPHRVGDFLRGVSHC
jgi:hypothetical protein